MTTDPRPVGSISEETARLLDALGWVLDGARPARTNTEPSAQSAEAEPAKAAKAGSAEPREAAAEAQSAKSAKAGSAEPGEAAAEAQSAKSAKAGSAEPSEAGEAEPSEAGEAEPRGAGEAAEEAAEAGSHPSACSWCPVCRGMASLRSVNPDAVDRLADAATVLAQALSDLAVQVREDAPPGGRSTPGKAPGGRRTPGKAAGAAAYTIPVIDEEE